MEFLSFYNLLLALLTFSAYCISLAVYRLYLSPLARFPGPKLAALTLWYEFYYDVIKRGRYTWKIAELHERHGPIIRISPYELHINDPDYYDELYVGTSIRRSMKYQWSMKGFGPTIATFSTESHELHRTRAAALAPFFSKASVYHLEPSVQSIVDQLVARLRTVQGAGSNVNMVDVFTSLTGDVISQYAFARPFGFMRSPDFSPHWHQLMMELSETSHVFKQFGWLEPMMRSIPPSLIKMASPKLSSLFGMQDTIRAQVLEIKKEHAEGRKPSGRRTIIYDILTNDQIRPQDKETERLLAEALSVVAAGTTTTAHTLSVLAFHILHNPGILNKLQHELESIMPKPDSQPRWSELEQLPYMTACIQEALRWGYGVSHRLQRMFPDTALQYKNWRIPVNTPVGMTSVMLHDDPSLFPNPRSFQPERWLQPSKTQLRKYLVPFGKGSRSCLGMNLAYCELYLTLAAIFAPNRFRFELYETDVTDVEIAHDFFNPCYRANSKGMRVVVH
ncbi:hypothetical protein HO133_010181 [Letharia lupina]|uniref:Cytochrome P450 n=1 Tax=Letharia lupina TaxID=560253 RepID=A0A8H6CKW7_9LECA|nr:uncharacterized protein HO133_010181 [Letharia lupina]KAF6224986.1 hypothetical protein HO133_010181 [Letharia lupina]